jgi:hypothetical protein
VDKITEVFLNWQVLLISFAAFAVLGIIKNIGTKKDKDKKIIGGFAQHQLFSRLLPLYPYVLASGFCFIPGVPLPEVVTGTLAVKILFGIYAGWLSGFSFQLVKSVLAKSGVKVGDEDWKSK